MFCRIMYNWMHNSVSDSSSISVKKRWQITSYHSLEYLTLFSALCWYSLWHDMHVHCPLQPPSGRLVKGDWKCAVH